MDARGVLVNPTGTYVWTGGLRELHVTVTRREGDYLPAGYWEVHVVETGTKVFARPVDLRAVRFTSGGAA